MASSGLNAAKPPDSDANEMQAVRTARATARLRKALANMTALRIKRRQNARPAATAGARPPRSWSRQRGLGFKPKRALCQLPFEHREDVLPVAVGGGLVE